MLKRCILPLSWFVAGRCQLGAPIPFVQQSGALPLYLYVVFHCSFAPAAFNLARMVCVKKCSNAVAVQRGLMNQNTTSCIIVHKHVGIWLWQHVLYPADLGSSKPAKLLGLPFAPVKCVYT